MKHKKVLKHLLSVCLCTALVLICLLGITVNAQAASESDLTFKLNEDGESYSVSDCHTSAEGELMIPSTYNGKQVTNIGDYAFQYCDLTSVSIPEGITGIGYSAFSFCRSLTNITIPDSVLVIEDEAFEQCSGLISVAIPKSVTYIGDSVFSGCSDLMSVTIDDNVPYIGEDAFADCESLVYNIYNNAKYLGNDNNPYVVLIESSADDITSCEINSGTKIIYQEAFKDCSKLTSITIPNSVTAIGCAAFSGCSSLESMSIPFVGFGEKSSYPFGYIFGYDYYSGSVETEQEYYSFSYREDATFYIPATLKSVTVTGGNIPYGAFYNCNNLTSAIIGNSVEKIGECAFYHCDGLISVTIGNGVTAIDNGAFQMSFSSNLQNVYTTDIANWCGIDFESRTANPLQFGDYLYVDGNLITDLIIPNGVTAIGDYAFVSCEIKSVSIPDSVVDIGDSAFYNCNGLTKMSIPASVKNIGEQAFGLCCNLKCFSVNENNPYYSTDDKGVIFSKDKSSLICVPSGLSGSYTVPGSVTTIDKLAFSQCINLDSVTLSENVKTIEDYAFQSCGITSITIPEGVTTIGQGAFNACDLTSVTIPESVTSIGESAFLSCNNLTDVTIKGSNAVIDFMVFGWCDSLTKITFTGNAPEFGNYIPDPFSITAYYPANNSTWTEDKLQNYGGNITWVPYTPVQFEIIGQPTTQKVADGKTAKFTVTATGDNITYQWQYRSSSSGSWKNASATGNKTATLSVPATVSRTGYQYRCVITDEDGNKIYSNAAHLYVLGIKTQPKTQKVKDGKTAKFTVTATGAGKKYQWQYRTSSSGSWKNASATGNKTATLSVPATVSRSGYQYRCKITDSANNVIYTNAVNLYVLGIKTQPVSKTVVADKTAKFTVTATGAGKTYQWQYRTSSKGSWKNASATGNKTASLSVSATTAKHGYQYRCKITDNAGNVIYTKTVNLYVLGIKTQPVSKTVIAGKTVKFTVAAAGRGLTYQWQYKAPSGSWKAVSASSGKTANYSLTAKDRHNGYQYRCRIKDSAGNVVYTKTVKLTVK